MLFVLVFVLPAPAQSTSQDIASTAKPASQIDLSVVGFEGLAGMARLASQANLSLDFVDDDHVLFTFDPKKLFTRLPDCPPSHDDRSVHAAIVQVSSGKVVRTANWYLHDRKRYLWPLGSGQFLLRRLNSLYVVDSDLKEKLLMTSPKEFLWLTVTPDGKQIIVETADGETSSKKSQSASAQVKPQVKIEFLDIATLKVQRTVKSEGVVTLEGTSSGFADVGHGLTGRVWLVRFGPTSRQRENIARVRSRCIPDVFYSSSNTLLIGRCSSTGSDYSVSAFTLTGHRLWHQRWSEHRYVPKMKSSEDGSRFAVSTLIHIAPPDSAAKDSDEEDDSNHSLEQSILVFNTASGTPILALKVSPVVLTAQNFSLSPDGRKLAALGESSLQIYDLPLMSDDDHAKYTAAMADVPGLYMPSSGTELQVAASGEDDTFGAAEAATDAAETDSPDAQKIPPRAPQPEPAVTPIGQPVAATKGPDKDGSPSLITFKANTRIVVVDVIVADQKGKPVKGLSQGDFQVGEDGKPQSVSNFEEFSTESFAKPPTTSTMPLAPVQDASTKLPPNLYTNNSKAPEVHSATLILLDLLNTPVTDQFRAREQLIKFLKGKPPGTQMALCTLSMNLRLIQGFTQDENLLVATVNGKRGGVKANPWQGDTSLNRGISLMQDLAALDASFKFTEQLMQQERDEQTAHDIDMRMRFTLDALAQLARYLSGIPGRKNVIWLSGSFPINMFPNPALSEQQGISRNYSVQLKKMTNLLAEAHVAVYPINVKGATTHIPGAGASEGYRPPQIAGSLAPSAPGGGNPALANIATSLPPSGVDSEALAAAAEDTTMDDVAAQTGGKAFYNGNGIAADIETAADLGTHYYSLSYKPINKRYDGKFRKIKISLNQKGYHLTYRQGYYAVDPDAPLKDTIDPMQRIGLAAMQQGSPQSRQIVFAARVVPMGKPKKVDASRSGVTAKPTGKKKNSAAPVEMQHYGIDYAVDPAHLMFTPTSAGSYHGVVDFMVTAFNEDGRLIARLASTATNDLKPANYKAVMIGGFRLHQELDVPVDAVSLRLGVEDGTNNHIGTLEIPLPVPVPPEVPKVVARSLPEIESD